MDSIAEAQVENLTDHLYTYKDRLPIPPLGMVDDQINVAYCGLDSALTTSHLNAQTNLKRLQFGAKNVKSYTSAGSAEYVPRCQ